jgi:hypothetical protein
LFSPATTIYSSSKCAAGVLDVERVLRRHDAVKKDSDMYKALDALAQQVRIRGIFSDWPAMVTDYANCMGLE